MVPRFGTDGVRGLANSELTPDAAMALGRAAAEVLGATRFVVGRDTRRSGPMLESALVAGICSAGVDVSSIGVIPTPAVAWVAADQAIAGAMISASHNPFADNGIKIFGVGGSKLADAVETEIGARMVELLEGSAPLQPVGPDVGFASTRSPTGSYGEGQAAVSGWADSIADSVEPGNLGSLSVVLDTAHGAAVGWAPEIFRRLGMTVHTIGDRPDGVNINEGVGSTYPDALAEAVVARGADAGLAFDGDADRVIAVDETGNVVDGDRMLAVLAHDYASRGRLANSTVVVTVMTNLGFHRAMEQAGISVISTNVGDRYVLQALNEYGLSLGGEQSGHVICRDLAGTGDGVLAGVQFLDAVVRSGQAMSKLANDVMVTVPQQLRNVRLPQRQDSLLAELSEVISDIEQEFGNKGRVLVRMSGTEPLLRVMIEHVDADVANQGCQRIVDEAERRITAS